MTDGQLAGRAEGRISRGLNSISMSLTESSQIETISGANIEDEPLLVEFSVRIYVYVKQGRRGGHWSELIMACNCIVTEYLMLETNFRKNSTTDQIY